LAIDGLTETEVRMFVQKNVDYYLNKWKNADKTRKGRWNWAACWEYDWPNILAAGDEFDKLMNEYLRLIGCAIMIDPYPGTSSVKSK